MYASGATCRHVHRVQLPARNSYSPTCNDQGVYQPTIDHYNVYKTLPQTTDANGTVFPPVDSQSYSLITLVYSTCTALRCRSACMRRMCEKMPAHKCGT